MKFHGYASLLSSIVLLLGPKAGVAETAVYTLPIEDRFQNVVIPATLGIITNLDDVNSVAFGRAYARIRGIPPENIVGLHLKRQNLVAKEYFRDELENLRVHPKYEGFSGFALAFDKPYKVGLHQSITAAISQGVEELRWTGACNPTTRNPDAGKAAGAQLAVKPAMLVTAGSRFTDNVALAERGLKADMSDPLGDVFLLRTSDNVRSEPRDQKMIGAYMKYRDEINIKMITANVLENQDGILGYQLGTSRVAHLDTLGFRPGGYADHLTSVGGMLYDKKDQTTALELINAGATGSYGAVREPCAIREKFPDPERMLGAYLHGDTLLEAYWKSISMTTEGLLIGEPLARPFPILDARITEDGQLTLRVNRHTLAFLSEPRKASDPVQKSFRIAVYDMRGEARALVGEVAVPADARPADVIGTFNFAPGKGSGLMLGILAR